MAKSEYLNQEIGATKKDKCAKHFRIAEKFKMLKKQKHFGGWVAIFHLGPETFWNYNISSGNADQSSWNKWLLCRMDSNIITFSRGGIQKWRAFNDFHRMHLSDAVLGLERWGAGRSIKTLANFSILEKQRVFKDPPHQHPQSWSSIEKVRGESLKAFCFKLID